MDPIPTFRARSARLAERIEKMRKCLSSITGLQIGDFEVA